MIKDITVRFFVYDDEAGEFEIREVEEGEFLSAPGVIGYERHSVFANGVRQICLTKNPF